MIALTAMAVVGVLALTMAMSLKSLGETQAQSGSSSTSVTPVASKIRYQGQLTDGAVPLDGIYDMEFQLWTAATEGNQAGSSVAIPGVCVTNGLFSVVLPVEAAEFDGKALWGEVK